jgi:hypothetical protein
VVIDADFFGPSSTSVSFGGHLNLTILSFKSPDSIRMNPIPSTG